MMPLQLDELAKNRISFATDAIATSEPAKNMIPFAVNVVATR
jgi:hypothetical protein